ncbi:MAG: hypothetical protein JWO36_4210 [Myxococcales bacterium]|nr:hypothetical protein [Myxococcales bacterium]
MRRAVVAVALFAACHGDTGARHDAGRDRPASAISAVPRLPPTEDGAEEMRALDQRIEIHRAEPGLEISLLLDRAQLRGQVEDYQAAVAMSAAWIARAPKDPAAWRARTVALTRVHAFTEARAALEHMRPLVVESTEWSELATAIDEATGKLAASIPAREAAARIWANASNLSMLANSLALQGNYDDALAAMARAAEALRAPTPELAAWTLFQWGRIHEQKGELAIARQFYEASLARLPGSLEPTVHLAQALIGTGDTAAANRLVERALAENRHPALLALAAPHQPALVDEAKRGWERYVAALPLAFSDHAARFYLGVGDDPRRAAVLAAANLANRDTYEARSLLVEAALASKDAPTACMTAGPLVARSVPRPYRFVAWRAFSECKRPEADVLAREFGMTH